MHVQLQNTLIYWECHYVTSTEQYISAQYVIQNEMLWKNITETTNLHKAVKITVSCTSFFFFFEKKKLVQLKGDYDLQTDSNNSKATALSK